MSESDRFSIDFNTEIRNRIRDRTREQQQELRQIRIVRFTISTIISMIMGGLFGIAGYQMTLVITGTQFKTKVALGYSLLGALVLGNIYVCSMLFLLKFFY